MARCKDCFHWDACKKMLESFTGHCIPSGYEGGADRCEDFISAADVAPRAEVAREIFEEIEFDIHQLMFDRDETRAIAIEGIIANLKKKYTGGEDTNVPAKKDYYTPEEVRNMSHSEISNNLTVIRESMKRWREE